MSATARKGSALPESVGPPPSVRDAQTPAPQPRPPPPHPAAAKFRNPRQPDLLKRINLIWVVQSLFQKYSASRFTQIKSISLAVSPHERGVSRSSRTRGGMRWTRQRRAHRQSQGGFNEARERSSGAQTNDVASVFTKASAGVHRPTKPLGEDGSRTAKPCGPGTRCWC
jgi:hypothetical protein